MRGIETHLLSAFYGYTQTIQKRFEDLDLSDVSIRDRLTALENRFLELERKIRFPATILKNYQAIPRARAAD